jgi:PAS domain S-box-containing protein
MARELRQLVDTANAPIFGIDVHGNVNEWNDKTAEITGFSRVEAFGCPLVSKFIVPSLRQSVKDVMDNALNGNETSNYELEFETKSKEIRYLLVNATTRRDAESRIVGVVGVAQDVTDDRQHFKELRQLQYIRASQEAKVETERNMTAYFAHELRNPLHAIDSALKLMPDELSPDARNLIHAMNECTSFMSSIMNNLLDVRKMEEGKMILNKKPLSVKALLERVHSMLLASVRPGVKMVIVCKTEDKDWVLGDSHRIQQVLTNVITNAIKYTSAGSIVLSMQWKGKMLRFECVDTGPGIPKQDQSKLFQRFVQRGGAPGTGLGLAIAKHLVGLVGGNIGFESDPTVKSGTTCVVELPLEPCDEPENLGESRLEEIAMIEEPIKFLIIDDVAMNRVMFRRRLKKGIAPNATIEEAPTGEKALEICKDNTFDVIIVDQHMEEAGGVLLGTETVVAMRSKNIESIIIGCSGNDIDDEFMEAGSDWVMGKPTPPNAIILREFKRLISEFRHKENGALPSMSTALSHASHQREPEKKKRRVCNL